MKLAIDISIGRQYLEVSAAFSALYVALIIVPNSKPADVRYIPEAHTFFMMFLPILFFFGHPLEGRG